MKIEIESSDVDVFEGVSKRTGNPFSIRKQRAVVFLGNSKYPEPLELNLRDEQPAYSPGVYTLAPESFRVGRYKDLEVQPVLVPHK